MGSILPKNGASIENSGQFRRFGPESSESINDARVDRSSLPSVCEGSAAASQLHAQDLRIGLS